MTNKYLGIFLYNKIFKAYFTLNRYIHLNMKNWLV